MSNYRSRSQSNFSSQFKIRLLIAGAIILFSILGYFSNVDVNPATGKRQRVGGITTQEEIAMGLQSVPIMVEQFQGESRDQVAVRTVEQMGDLLVSRLQARLQVDGLELPYLFRFHLLGDKKTVNAFALPGGQVFITEALYDRLNHEGQLAGVLGHEIGHVLERHSAQQMAKGQMFSGFSMAAGVATGDVTGTRAVEFLTQLISMKYSRSNELESDRWGVELMALAGYHPEHMIEVMNILEEASGSASQPEFASTHPLPEHRREYINKIIGEVFPYGIPEGLQ